MNKNTYAYKGLFITLEGVSETWQVSTSFSSAREDLEALGDVVFVPRDPVGLLSLSRSEVLFQRKRCNV